MHFRLSSLVKRIAERFSKNHSQSNDESHRIGSICYLVIHTGNNEHVDDVVEIKLNN